MFKRILESTKYNYFSENESRFVLLFRFLFLYFNPSILLLIYFSFELIFYKWKKYWFEIAI